MCGSLLTKRSIHAYTKQYEPIIAKEKGAHKRGEPGKPDPTTKKIEKFIFENERKKGARELFMRTLITGCQDGQAYFRFGVSGVTEGEERTRLLYQRTFTFFLGEVVNQILKSMQVLETYHLLPAEQQSRGERIVEVIMDKSQEGSISALAKDLLALWQEPQIQEATHNLTFFSPKRSSILL